MGPEYLMAKLFFIVIQGVASFKKKLYKLWPEVLKLQNINKIAFLASHFVCKKLIVFIHIFKKLLCLLWIFKKMT